MKTISEEEHNRIQQLLDDVTAPDPAGKYRKNDAGLEIERLIIEARCDELEGIKEHHEAIPLPWEVGTGPYIEGRLVALDIDKEA